MVAAVLANPSPHLGKRYRPTGPRLISADDVAAIVGHILGRKVRYQDISDPDVYEVCHSEWI